MRQLGLVFFSFFFLTTITSKVFAQTEEPLVLYTFTVKYLNVENAVEVRWVVQNPEINATYEVIRLYDDFAYDVVGTIHTETNGLSEFKVFDFHPNPGANYYRVRKVDAEGVLEVSPIASLKIDERALQLARVSPNPASKFLNVHTYTNLEEPAILTFLSANGELVKKEEILLESGLNKFQLDLRGLPAGPYFFILNTGIYQVERLIFVAN